MNRNCWLVVLPLVLLLPFFATPARALEFVVNSDTDLPDANPGDGSALTSEGTTSLRAAIEEANVFPGKDVVVFSPPLIICPSYFCIGTISLTSTLFIEDDLVITAEEMTMVYLDCLATRHECFRPVEVRAGVELTMTGIRIVEGWQSPDVIRADRGATLFIHPGATVALHGCVFQDGNAATAGGGIYVDHATLEVGGFIHGTSDGDGGAIYNDHGIVRMTGSGSGTAAGRGGLLFNNHGIIALGRRDSGDDTYDNHANEDGGTIYSLGGLVTILSMNLRENSALRGGVVYLSDHAHMELTNCSFHSNSAAVSGAVVYVESGTLWASMCTFGRGTAGATGGAVAMVGGDAVFLNCTFMENTAGTMGGALAVGGGALCALGNTVLAGNTSTISPETADLAGPIESLGHNLIGVSDAGSGYAGSDLLGTAASPLLAGLLYQSQQAGCVNSLTSIYVPQPGSPVIDAGDTALLFRRDFVGGACFDALLEWCPRVRNGAVDIGAIEVQEGSIDLTCSGSHSADFDGDGRIGLSELLRVIQFYNGGPFHCASGTEDGYAPGAGDQTCTPHSADYAPRDWQINLAELLRVIQIYTMGGYHACPEGEDGFCAGVL